jgi:hypothetical protein
MYKLLVLQVKELMELQLSVYEIARKMNVDPSVVQAAMEIIKGWST